jgi:hypothetical protein
MTTAAVPLSAAAIAEASAILAVVQASDVRAFGPSSKRIVEAARSWGSDQEWETVRGAALKGERVNALAALLSEWSAALHGGGGVVASPSVASSSAESALDTPSSLPSKSLTLPPAEWDAALKFLQERRSRVANRVASGVDASTTSGRASSGWEDFETAAPSHVPPSLVYIFRFAVI